MMMMTMIIIIISIIIIIIITCVYYHSFSDGLNSRRCIMQEINVSSYDVSLNSSSWLIHRAITAQGDSWKFPTTIWADAIKFDLTQAPTTTIQEAGMYCEVHMTSNQEAPDRGHWCDWHM